MAEADAYNRCVHAQRLPDARLHKRRVAHVVDGGLRGADGGADLGARAGLHLGVLGEVVDEAGHRAGGGVLVGMGKSTVDKQKVAQARLT